MLPTLAPTPAVEAACGANGAGLGRLEMTAAIGTFENMRIEGRGPRELLCPAMTESLEALADPAAGDAAVSECCDALVDQFWGPA